MGLGRFMSDPYTLYQATQTRNTAGEMATSWTQQETGQGFLYETNQAHTTAAGALVIAAATRILLPLTTAANPGNVIAAAGRTFRVTATRVATRTIQADLEETSIQVGD